MGTFKHVCVRVHINVCAHKNMCACTCVCTHPHRRAIGGRGGVR